MKQLKNVYLLGTWISTCDSNSYFQSSRFLFDQRMEATRLHLICFFVHKFSERVWRNAVKSGKSLKVEVLSDAPQKFARHSFLCLKPSFVLFQPRFLHPSFNFLSKTFLQYKLSKMQWCDKDFSLRLSWSPLNQWKEKCFPHPSLYTQTFGIFWTWDVLPPEKMEVNFLLFIALKLRIEMTCSEKLFEGPGFPPWVVFSFAFMLLEKLSISFLCLLHCEFFYCKACFFTTKHKYCALSKRSKYKFWACSFFPLNACKHAPTSLDDSSLHFFASAMTFCAAYAIPDLMLLKSEWNNCFAPWNF